MRSPELPSTMIRKPVDGSNNSISRTGKLLAARSAQHSGRTVPFSMCLKHSIIFRKLKEAIIRQKQKVSREWSVSYLVLRKARLGSLVETLTRSVQKENEFARADEYFGISLFSSSC